MHNLINRTDPIQLHYCLPTREMESSENSCSRIEFPIATFPFRDISSHEKKCCVCDFPRQILACLHNPSHNEQPLEVLDHKKSPNGTFATFFGIGTFNQEHSTNFNNAI